jgi:Fe-S cluster biogenesis protein NfuA
MTDQPNPNMAAADAPIETRLGALIENISAYIEFYHGGWVKLVDFDGATGTAYVKLGGACEGCALSTMTLRGWVEGTVHQFFPEIQIMPVLEE